jgi:hypothetical protein
MRSWPLYSRLALTATGGIISVRNEAIGGGAAMTAPGSGAYRPTDDRRARPTDDRPAPKPRLTLPWEGGVTGWIVVFGAVVAELIIGIVINPLPAVPAALVLALPVAVAAAFAIVQWRQVRSSGAEPASWWHLTGVVLAVFTWVVWPTSPGVLYGAGSARGACLALISRTPTSDCLSRAAHAMDSSNLAWWLTGVLIVAAALLARRSKIAAWAAIPAALAGCLLATHYLELLLLHYHAGG